MSDSIVVSAGKVENQDVKQDVNSLGIAAVGGGGIGTLMVGFAQLIPESNSWRSVLMIIAPAVSAGISTLWIWVVGEYSRRRQDKIAQATITQMRTYLRERIDDPKTSEEMKEDYERKLALLEDTVFKRELRKIE